MGIQLSKATEYGDAVTANYWNIHSAMYVKADKVVNVVLAGYASKAAADSGAKGLAFISASMRGDNLPLTDDGVSFKKIYELISAAPEWEGAKAVLEDNLKT